MFLLHRLLSKIAFSERHQMSRTKQSGVRQIATITTAGVALVALAALLVVNVTQSNPKHIATAEFLNSQFVDGQYLEGFTPGAPEYGFSLEALSQLSFAREIDSSEAVEFLLQSSPSFLYSPDTGQLIPGLAGKYLFASKVTGATNKSNVDLVLKDLVQIIGKNGDESELGFSIFDFSWLALGLYAQDQKEIASNVSLALADLAREDGGFGFDSSEFTTASSTDATSMAILALELTKNINSEHTPQKQKAIDAAASYLSSNLVEGNHFVAYDAVDVNGSALAFMALKSVGSESNFAIQSWLLEQLRNDAGIGSPWVEDVGDRFATAQGYLAIEGKTYLDLVGR